MKARFAARLALALALAAGVELAPASAQTFARTEVTPFAGARAGGSFVDEPSSTKMEIRPSGSFGLMLDFPWEDNSQLEIYLSRQPTRVKSESGAAASPDFDLNVDYYHIGGTVMLEKIRDAETYLVATVGATRFDPPGSSLDSEVRFSFSIGLGLKYPVAERLKLRFEGRVFVTSMDSDSTIFCNLPGACNIKVNADVLTQFEASLGLSFAF